MTDGRRKPPEQVSLDAEFEDRAEPSGIDSIPLLQESHDFPEQREVEDQGEADSPAQNADEAGPEPEQQGLLTDEGQDGLEPDEDESELAEDVEAEALPESTELESEFEAEPVVNRFPVQWVLSGLADLTVHLAVVVIGVLSARFLQIPLDVSQWPGFLGFALSFSFLYTSLPLAFWGQTPGMAISGLRAADGEHQLSFGQTTMRWIASILTVCTLGLPLLLARTGRPLADRLSRSEP